MAMMDPSIDEKKIDRIIDKCKAELNQSYYKYGEARKNYGDARVDALGTLDNCLIKFNKTHNTEYLHDAIYTYYYVLCSLCRVITLNRLVRRVLQDQMEPYCNGVINCLAD